MRTIKIAISGGGVIAVFLILAFGSPEAQFTPKENHCFTCHTNARKLIEITREIAKTDKGRPGGSAETEGEG